MSYRIEILTPRLGDNPERVTRQLDLIGLYTRDMIRQQFDAGAAWVHVTVSSHTGNDRPTELYSALFERSDQLALASQCRLQDIEGIQRA